MPNTTVDKYTVGFGVSLAITSLLNALILVIKETSPPVMAWMRSALGHHWITHGVIVILVFVVLGFILSGLNLETRWDARKVWRAILAAVLISALVTAAFFFPELKGPGTSIKY